MKLPHKFKDFVLPPTDGKWSKIIANGLFTKTHTYFSHNPCDSLYHNSLGPAQISFTETLTGTIDEWDVRYYVNNVLHRLDGPALIQCSYAFKGDGSKLKEEYYINGHLYYKIGYAVGVIMHLMGVGMATAHEVIHLINELA